MLITDKVSHTDNQLAVYFPYSDWIIERWPNYFLPALDAFRKLGMPVNVLPYPPPLEEAVYPYYPFHHNKDVMQRLLVEKTVLILPNVSGFQQTDSDLIKPFIEQDGVVLAFGPQIPMGRSYERSELFGIDETAAQMTHNALVVKSGIGTRAKTVSRFGLVTSESPTPTTVWKLTSARVVASFEDGSPAVTINKYGKGAAIVVLPDALTAAHYMRELTLDVLDHALSFRNGSSLVDIIGTNETSDVAITPTTSGFRVAIVNHDSNELSIALNPTTRALNNSSWFDLANEKLIGSGHSIKVTVPARAFRAIEFRRIDGQKRTL